MRLNETELMLKGWGQTTAEFFYPMPGFTQVLNSCVCQDYDIAPDCPALFKFAEFWRAKLDVPLHLVRFIHRKLIGLGKWWNVKGKFRLRQALLASSRGFHTPGPLWDIIGQMKGG